MQSLNSYFASKPPNENSSGANDRLEFFRAFAERGMGVLYDDMSEGIPVAMLIAPAAKATPELINQLISIAGDGTIFVALGPERAELLMLQPMNQFNDSHLSCGEGTPDRRVSAELLVSSCISVEAREGVSTGISATDRAITIALLAEDPPSPRKLIKPGHIFPLLTVAGGTLVKSALPEAAVDVIRITSGKDAAVALIFTSAESEQLDLKELQNLCKEQLLPILSVASLVEHRLATESLITLEAEARLPTRLAGELKVSIFRSAIHSAEHVALVKGTITPGELVLVRVQTEFTLGDVFGGGTPPSRSTLEQALALIAKREKGILLYLKRPVSGQLTEQVLAINNKQETKQGSQMREFGIGAQILRALGATRIDIITNTPKQLVGLETFGIEIVSQIPLTGGS